MRIDSHQHFWDYDPAEYPWIPPGSAIHRSFKPADLEPLLRSANIDGCIAVQARQDVKENVYLCALAEANPFVQAVVGWIDLRSDDVEQQAAAFKRLPKSVGVRHVVQDEADSEFMAREPFRRGIAALKKHGLVYDILIYAHQLPDAIGLVRDFPEQVFVLDHIAKPKIAFGEIQEWASRIQEIARYPNLSVKLSGMVTEADHLRWTSLQMEPYWNIVAEAFGPDRILYGSDWPVIQLASDYARWVDTVSQWLEGFSAPDQKKIWGGNAQRVYLSGAY
jgi:L-fuconolactonase